MVVKRMGQMLMLAGLLAAAAACGSESQDSGKSEVATLASPGGTPAPSATAAGKRPRERLDTTQEEMEGWYRIYDECLSKEGAKSKKEIGNRRPTQAEIAKQEAAARVCDPQYLPLPPWEKDPANPEAKDFARDVLKCLKDKGVKLVEIADDGINMSFGGPQNDKTSISKGLRLTPDCEREVAARKK
ncbi:hypothetical protein Asp14428_08070 [Actinoplanes sp. NBRC 14428]|nr:hypothetical protein Asp14428_08070 [Actinoplanes sp. NBRC 14428]